MRKSKKKKSAKYTLNSERTQHQDSHNKLLSVCGSAYSTKLVFSSLRKYQFKCTSIIISTTISMTNMESTIDLSLMAGLGRCICSISSARRGWIRRCRCDSGRRGLRRRGRLGLHAPVSLGRCVPGDLDRPVAVLGAVVDTLEHHLLPAVGQIGPGRGGS